ncbi:MAG: acetyl-CoA carboxylase, carboxyltransferase subunit beta [Lachnospiraceae bacterium]|nr:acetyl-CoA carboxylase, carboxyltransferase subunit beta [Lachnospiraceae bacterium]
MELKTLFKFAPNKLEGEENTLVRKKTFVNCTSCGNDILKKDIKDALYICNVCNYYYKISARKRIMLLTDDDSFYEFDKDFRSTNILGFPEYDEKLNKAYEKTKENEAVITGKAKIDDIECCIFAMETNFIMASMGAVVGDKITRIFEYATENNLPVIGIIASGGARMQEGIISLMQMAKVSGAVKKHSDAGNFYLSLLTHPTTGGVEASFAMLGDVIIAEPGALVGFAGPRVIEQTLRKKLPENFQRAEEVLKCGFIDDIVDRVEQREYISKMLKYNRKA